MEKIVFGQTELSYDSIEVVGNHLVIGFVGGDIAALEQSFREAGQTALETIRQEDAAGNVQATHERYDIFETISKEIAADAAEDVIKVYLRQEDLVQMQIRHLQEVTDTLLMGDLAGELAGDTE